MKKIEESEGQYSVSNCGGSDDAVDAKHALRMTNPVV